MVKTNQLRGLIISKYGSLAEFAKQCGFSYSRAYRLVIGGQQRTEQDMRDIIQALQITDSETIVSLFSLR